MAAENTNLRILVGPRMHSVPKEAAACDGVGGSEKVV